MSDPTKPILTLEPIERIQILESNINVLISKTSNIEFMHSAITKMQTELKQIEDANDTIDTMIETIEAMIEKLEQLANAINDITKDDGK